MAVHVARMREMRTACRTLVGKLEAKKPRDQGSILNWEQREQLSGSMKRPKISDDSDEKRKLLTQTQ
jgi:hypothetical protein